MNTKFLISGAVVGGLLLFVWGAAYHMIIPWEKIALSEFKDTPAIVQAVRANAPQNGMYFAPQGVFAAVSFFPDMSDKTNLMGPMMVRELIKDLAVGLLLSVVLLWVGPSTVLGRARLLAMIALTAAISEYISDWNWYGFSGSFTLLSMGDIVIGWFLTGLALGGLMNKMRLAPAPQAHSAAA